MTPTQTPVGQARPLQTNYFQIWVKWMVLFAFLGFGLGVGMTAFGLHDAQGHRISNPLMTLGAGLAVAIFFSLVASLTAGLVNVSLSLAYRGRARPRNFLAKVPLSARVLTWATACGLGCGFIIWLVSARK